MFNFTTDTQIKSAIYFLLIVIAGFVLPLVLIPVINFTGYSEIVEELAKAAVILFLVFKLPNLRQQIAGVVIFGFLFGLSESIFYLNNIFQVGNMGIFWQRFFTAIPMHIITALLIFAFARFNKWLILVGFFLASFLHILFNIFA